MPDIVVMFFMLGLIAGVVKSDLEIPKAAYDVMSLLLMLIIGLKGGMALHDTLGWHLMPELIGIACLGFVIPAMLYPILRKVIRLNLADSISFSAHYGSVSAGTFAVALAYTESKSMAIGGQETLYLVLLELPAILFGLILFKKLSSQKERSSYTHIVHEALTNRSVILLVGGVVIGSLYGPIQGAAVTDLYTTAFKGVLALFLLEMGLVASNALLKVTFDKWRIVLFSLFMPPILALLGIQVGQLIGLPNGSILILACLTASASYIAAPAAIRAAIPQADIGLVMLASLGLTFPFNVLIGIPLYHSWIS
tara:strand:+ start:227523 stop:228452 length:930 start_codon:yes stop_codon:yes gene_type:complete